MQGVSRSSVYTIRSRPRMPWAHWSKESVHSIGNVGPDTTNLALRPQPATRARPAPVEALVEFRHSLFKRDGAFSSGLEKNRARLTTGRQLPIKSQPALDRPDAIVLALLNCSVRLCNSVRHPVEHLRQNSLHPPSSVRHQGLCVASSSDQCAPPELATSSERSSRRGRDFVSVFRMRAHSHVSQWRARRHRNS